MTRKRWGDGLRGAVFPQAHGPSGDWEDEPRRQRMREALTLLRQIVREEQGHELSWIEQNSDFELYVEGVRDSVIGLDELQSLEVWRDHLIEEEATGDRRRGPGCSSRDVGQPLCSRSNGISEDP